MSLLSFLSTDEPQSNDSWSQAQREALIDLLYVTIYADNHLSQTEENAVKTQLKQIDWQAGDDIDLYVNSAINRARDARNNEGYRSDYLKDIGTRLESDTAKEKALGICDATLRSDGFAEKEAELLSEIQSAWK